ncbi:MAG: YebC/PmpR family DNA-binding transcriptional regulator, partial [Myxococcota bacterium]
KRWDRMAKAFTRCGKEITIAVRQGGSSPDDNPSLRRAIQNARAVNMPKDKIQAAIAKASGNDGGADYQEILYEGYGPHGVAILVETATDNPTRTVANVRHHFKKGGGNMGNSGSVSFMFNKMCAFRLKPDGVERDELELTLIDYGLEELTDGEDNDGNPILIAYGAFTSFGDLQGGLEEVGIEPVSSGAEWIPTATTELDEGQTDEVLALIDRLEQDDDVQSVFHTLS